MRVLLIFLFVFIFFTGSAFAQAPNCGDADQWCYAMTDDGPVKLKTSIGTCARSIFERCDVDQCPFVPKEEAIRVCKDKFNSSKYKDNYILYKLSNYKFNYEGEEIYE